MVDDLNIMKMEDDHNFFENGRRPQCLLKWKTTSSSLKMEDNLIFINKFLQKKDDLNILKNRRLPQQKNIYPTAQHIIYFQAT